MSDESTESLEGEASSAFTRRNALKAGVAAGVGAAVWSGVSITSLGGTPAYAAGCTGAVLVTLQACRNTDQGKCSSPSGTVAYHPLAAPASPYGLQNNIADNSGICCDQFPSPQPYPVFTFPTTQKCSVRFEAYSNGNSNCTSRNQSFLTFSQTFGPSTSGSITVAFSCPPGIASTFWTLYAVCHSNTVPDSCFTNP